MGHDQAEEGRQRRQAIQPVRQAAARGGGRGARGRRRSRGQHDARVGRREGEASSVPNDNIERAIKRGSGADAAGVRYEEVTYEGYAPGGIALFVEALTDNRNRTAQDVRHAFTRGGGNLGETGSTAWMFTRKGLIVVEKAAAPDEEHLLEQALEAGAEDVRDAESSWEVVTDPTDLARVRDALRGDGTELFSAELTMLPQSTIPVDGSEARKVLQVIEMLDDLEDVQSVYANFDIPEEVMAAL